MITLFNRCELATFFSMEQCGQVASALSGSGIPYFMKTVNRTSPSIFGTGTRERSGTLFQNQSLSYRYIIYVRRKDLAHAQEVTHLGPIP